MIHKTGSAFRKNSNSLLAPGQLTVIDRFPVMLPIPVKSRPYLLLFNQTHQVLLLLSQFVQKSLSTSIRTSVMGAASLLGKYLLKALFFMSVKNRKIAVVFIRSVSSVSLLNGILQPFAQFHVPKSSGSLMIMFHHNIWGRQPQPESKLRQQAAAASGSFLKPAFFSFNSIPPKEHNQKRNAQRHSHAYKLALLSASRNQDPH